MIKIHPHIVEGIRATTDVAGLRVYLQNAIELEHSTIPPYLTAMFSLHPQTNREIWDVIHSVVIEEMLHFTIAANILNALGGNPQIYNPQFVPEYPGPLPMGVAQGLIVGLEKYSKDQVKNTFMEIESPNDPIDFPRDMNAVEEVDYKTIGDFYNAIKEKIEILPLIDDKFPGDEALQVVLPAFFSPEELFPIVYRQDALNAIDIIIEQGEGTATSPLDPEGEFAHYYRFEELYVGRRLVPDSTVPQGYSFTGAEIPFDEQAVWNIFPNTKLSMLTPGTEEYRNQQEFNLYYGRLLNGLQITFNGQPDWFNNTLGLMFDLKLVGERLCAMDFPGKAGYKIGPSFEFEPGPLT